MGTQSVSVFVALVRIWSMQSSWLGYELTITEMPSLGLFGLPFSCELPYRMKTCAKRLWFTLMPYRESKDSTTEEMLFG